MGRRIAELVTSGVMALEGGMVPGAACVGLGGGHTMGSSVVEDNKEANIRASYSAALALVALDGVLTTEGVMSALSTLAVAVRETPQRRASRGAQPVFKPERCSWQTMSAAPCG